MQYKVLKDFKGSPDGRFAIDYKKDATVSLPDSLAAVALEEKWVAPVDDEAETKPGAKAKPSAKAANKH